MSAQRQTFGQMAEDALRAIQGGNNFPMVEPDMTATGKKRLEVAAQGLPVTIGELSAFFTDDLQSFGTGEVTQDTIRQLARWFAYQHLGRHDPTPEPTPKEAGMVRCTDCLQDRCSYRQVTPWGDVVVQSSPAWRWCKDYTARVHHLDDYRKR